MKKSSQAAAKERLEWVRAAQNHEIYYPPEVKLPADNSSANSLLFMINAVKGIELPQPVLIFPISSRHPGNHMSSSWHVHCSTRISDSWAELT